MCNVKPSPANAKPAVPGIDNKSMDIDTLMREIERLESELEALRECPHLPQAYLSQPRYRRSSQPKLPPELLYRVFRLAASSDYKTAHACAYVCKAVCRWTAADRWKTVIITNGRQFEALWRLLMITKGWGDYRHREKFLSLPSRTFVFKGESEVTFCPGEFVQNLFIDTQSAQYQRLTKRMSLESPPRSSDCSFRFLDHFDYLHYIAVGPKEASAFDMSRAYFPKKMLIAAPFRKVERCLNEIMYNGKRAGHGFARSNAQMWIPYRTGSCQRLTSIHVICLDLHGRAAELPPEELDSLRSGSLSYGIIRQILDNCLELPSDDEYPPRSPADQHVSSPADDEYSLIPTNRRAINAYYDQCEQGSTHIRFDAQGLHLSDPEEAARCLEPFFEEVTTTTAHDHHVQPGQDDNLTAKKAVLALHGCNSFEQLQLCWEPMPRSVEPKSESSTSDASHKCAMEHWKILPIAESEASKAFRSDIIETLRRKIGWMRQDQKSLDYTGRPAGTALLNERALAKLDSYCTEYHRRIATNSLYSDPIAKLPAFSADEKVKVHHVPPAERLSLGEFYVPYSKEQRVQWFLDNLETDYA